LLLLVGTRKGFKVQAPLVQQIEPCYLGRFCVLQHRERMNSPFLLIELKVMEQFLIVRRAAELGLTGARGGISSHL
jgi:hypothetical protein